MFDRAQASATILVADDYEPNRALVGNVLVWTGYQVLQAVDGCEALDLLETERPDVVLLDIQMPGVDGLDVLRRIRQSPSARLATLPVIVTTALSAQTDTAAALEAGATAVLVAPYSLRKLCETLAKVLAERPPGDD